MNALRRAFRTRLTGSKQLEKTVAHGCAIRVNEGVSVVVIAQTDAGGNVSVLLVYRDAVRVMLRTGFSM